MLTEKQQKQIEQSLWVVNDILKARGLSADEDLRQDCILYMCTCIERFDESRGIKFSTYAYANIEKYCQRKHNKQICQQRNIISTEDETAVADDDVPTETSAAILQEQLLGGLPPLYRKTIEMQMRGMSVRDIGVSTGMTFNQVRHILAIGKEMAREKYKQIEGEKHELP